MKLFSIIILFAFGILLMSCSSIPEQQFYPKGISPREVFVQFDSTNFPMEFVYLDKKLSQFKLSDDNILNITSIRTDSSMKENTNYKLSAGSFKMIKEVPSIISYKIDTLTIQRISRQFDFDFGFFLDPNPLPLTLIAADTGKYLYSKEIRTETRNRIRWTLSIYAVVDSTMKIKKILYYYSGDKVE